MPLPDPTLPPLVERERVGLLLRKARKEARLENAQAAELAGISVALLGNIERGTHSLTSIGVGNLTRLPAAFGLSWQAFVTIVSPVYGDYVPFLADGDTPPTPHPQHTAGVRHKSDSLELRHDVTMKDVYDLAQASKPLDDMEPDPEVSPIPVLTSDLYPGTVLFRVRGHSMSLPGNPYSIEEGDIIFCDTRDLAVKEDEIYVIHIPGDGVTVKRVRSLGGQIWLFSDNPDQNTYPPFQAQEARVIGRVHFAFRPLPQFKRRVW